MLLVCRSFCSIHLISKSLSVPLFPLQVLTKVLDNSKEKGKVVLVDFYAESVFYCYQVYHRLMANAFIFDSWCQPCKILSPILMKLATAEANEKTGAGAGIDLVTINTDEQGELAMQYEVRYGAMSLSAVQAADYNGVIQVSALPTVIAFKEGKPAQKFVGALPETGVRTFLSGL